MKYLHNLGNGIFHLDHRLTPEVRAMLASMASRLPDGGIQARYKSVVAEVAQHMVREINAANFLGQGSNEWSSFVGEAEERLTVYPLHPRVKAFFDEFVGNYGHSSIQEQVGDPAIYVEGVSWFTAWLLFDSPLVKGQEFSTRAVRHKDWPMARECATLIEERRSVTPVYAADGSIRKLIPGPIEREVQGHPDLVELHNGWLEVFDAEVTWWKDHLSNSDNRAALGIGDNEPFRPALDRARWALPGTIATGACFTSDLRERSRVLLDGKTLGTPEQPVWQDLAQAYCKAQPGIGPFALRKMFPKEPGTHTAHQTPTHLANILRPVECNRDGDNTCLSALLQSDGMRVTTQSWGDSTHSASYTEGEGQYADPWSNRERRVTLDIDCSLAVARDWHRHRTLYPWSMRVILDDSGDIRIARGYEPKSSFARGRVPALIEMSTRIYKQFMEAGDIQRAALALPLGTRVWMSGRGGWRDVKYTLELRARAHGANFEYKSQAKAGLRVIQDFSENPLGGNI